MKKRRALEIQNIKLLFICVNLPQTGGALSDLHSILDHPNSPSFPFFFDQSGIYRKWRKWRAFVQNLDDTCIFILFKSAESVNL